MSMRQHNRGDDASRRSRDAAVVPISPAAQETARGFFRAAPRPEPSSSTRGPTHESTSHVQTENVPNHSPSESMISRTRDPKKAVKPQSKSTKEVDKASSLGNRTGDRGGAPHEMDHPPLEEAMEEAMEVIHPSPAQSMSVESIAHPSQRPQQFYEEQLEELSTPQHELQAVVEEKNSLAHAHATLMQQCEEQSRKFSAMCHRCQQAENDYAILRKRHEEQSRQLNAALEQRQNAENHYANLKQGYEAQRNQISALGQHNDSLKALLEQRTSELYGVERFLTTADTFSGSEVVSTLRKLNEGVQQSMTFMAEWIVRNLAFEMPRTDKTNRQIIEQTRTSELLGMQFMRLLRTKKHVDNPILVEIALQAYLMYELCSIASRRAIIQGDQSRNSFIDGIYQRMREAEGQAVSGNWRALTHLYAIRARTDDPELTRTMDATIISGLSDVLLAAGCTGSKLDITSALKLKFGEKIRGFVELAGHVNTIIGAGVISEDFEVLAVPPGIPFDEKVMEDWDDSGVRGQEALNETKERQESVLCTIELGLMKRTRVAGAREKGELPESIMIKPKVALVSILNII